MRRKKKVKQLSGFKLFFVFLTLFGLIAGVLVIQKKTDFLGFAFGRKAEILVDAGSYFSATSFWQNLAQGGEEDGRMLAPCLSQIKQLKPEYIRIDHVLDFYNVVSRDASGKLVFDWTRLDLTLKDILAVQAKPFISISYFPPVLADKGDIIGQPKDWAEWELVVQKLVEHISGRGGLAIADTYYEVWNEPDLFGNFRPGQDKDYFKLYLHTQNGALKAVNTLPFRIGGPATTGNYQNWLEPLLKFVTANSLRFDFYSWHLYSFDPADFEESALAARKILADYPPYQNIELLVTEFGMTGENNQGYDNLLGAMHTLAAISALDGKVNRAFVFEIKDGAGPQKYWGRWGLLTNEKWGLPEEKPRFRAVEFLNRMTGDKVNIAGQGSWVKGLARAENGSIKLLLVNFDAKGKHFESVPVTFVNLPSGRFKYRREDFEGGIMVEKTVDIGTEGKWQTVEGLDPNSALILELTPLLK